MARIDGADGMAGAERMAGAGAEYDGAEYEGVERMAGAGAE